MKKASTVLCTVFVFLFALILLALLVTAPYLVSVFGARLSWSEQTCSAILIAFYCCALPAAVALGCLLALLYNIRADRPFSKRTGVLIGIISWCCAAVAVITFVAGFFDFPLYFVAVIMAFMFLIVRVVRMCFMRATELDEENTLTI